MGRGRKTRHFLGSNFLRAITVQGSMLPFCPGFFCLYSEKGHERGTPSKIIQNSEEKKLRARQIKKQWWWLWWWGELVVPVFKLFVYFVS